MQLIINRELQRTPLFPVGGLLRVHYPEIRISGPEHSAARF